MSNERRFYIGGKWVSPLKHDGRWESSRAVVDPSTEEIITEVALGHAADIGRAVKAARASFPRFSRTTLVERQALLRKVLEVFEASAEKIARTLSREMGAPLRFAIDAQAATGALHLRNMIDVLERFTFNSLRGSTLIAREPIGVCGLITPWNWPINQIMCKVAPALGAGCTIVLKPSELTPLTAILLAEVMHEAGVPSGVFNLVNGDGPEAGHTLAAHPDVDMISFTGSTIAGIQVAKTAADTVKRVHQELGGKSANIILPDADLHHAVALGVKACFRNSGQSCSAPTRMLVHARQHEAAVEIAKATTEALKMGSPSDATTDLGPVANKAQFDKIQRLIARGISEGAQLVTGGFGRPEGLDRGYYVKPTVFARVRPEMTIAQEEIFGPVLSIMSYASEEEAVDLANSTPYGLAAYVQSADLNRARAIASRMRAGTVHLNYPPGDAGAPFGGFKKSGNGREHGDFGLNEFLEIKAVVGYAAA